ncbi:putative non-specific serine/threonine protein kinase [Helianthus debilis subsp. tardiflorus]
MSRQPMNSCLASSSHIAAVFLFHCLVIFFLTISNISSSYGGNNETDYQALLKFKSMITNDPYRVLNSWNDSFHFCDWGGVSCGKRHKRVTRVELVSKGLEGSLSPHVGNLTFVREFLLFNNSFEGTIPHELGRLSRLRILHLSSNKFSGDIPTNLSRCSNLEMLYLDNNKLVGSLPKEISFLSKLKSLILDDNHLTGGIPPFMGNITSMEVFSAQRNPFGGSIPHTLGHLKRLREIWCSGCSLYGTIPHSIYNLSLLTHFALPANRLTGSLPLALGVMLPHLVFLQLRMNQLTGLLPPSISNCSKLGLLEMSFNRFSGTVSIDFGKLRDIYGLFIGNNLYGRGEADEMKFIDSLKNCSKLEVLELSTCNFQADQSVIFPISYVISM